jgi:hypothetical protein
MNVKLTDFQVTPTPYPPGHVDIVMVINIDGETLGQARRAVPLRMLPQVMRSIQQEFAQKYTATVARQIGELL